MITLRSIKNGRVISKRSEYGSFFLFWNSEDRKMLKVLLYNNNEVSLLRSDFSDEAVRAAGCDTNINESSDDIFF